MDVLCNYANADRFYHNFKHIGLMLDGLDTHFYPDAMWYGIPQEKYRQTPVYLQIKQAIIYHDVIYDARRNDNEARSAYEAEIAMMEEYDEDWIEEVQRLIMITKTHQPAQNDAPGQIITDLDLAGLASPNYIKHSQQIRQEFEFATDEQWYYGRQAFLTNFLGRDTVFHTSIGQNRWEADARRNMNLELNYINAKIDALRS
jgi:predicted metal-dependent HD superfamily phosphohydrolase